MTDYNEFKKCLLRDLNKWFKNNNYAVLDTIKIKKYDHGFEVIIFCGKSEYVSIPNIARIIYENKPVMASTYGAVGVDVKNSLGNVNHIRFSIRRSEK